MKAWRPPKVLILESQLIVAADISLQLSKQGYDVIGINTNPEDVGKSIEKHPPDILLMNIGVNSITNKMKSAKAISQTYEVPIVFISAHTCKDVFEQIINTNPYAFISKPFNSQDLHRGLQSALSRLDNERKSF